jgi:hypothetical protein
MSLSRSLTTGCHRSFDITPDITPATMYHLFKGLHTYLTRKDEYSVVIIGLDNVSCYAKENELTFIRLVKR